MKYFSGVNSLEALKREYKRLALENHPDRGGDTATMQAINAEYDEAFARLRDVHETADVSNSGGTQKRATAETAAEFRIIIDTLIRMGGIEIELCGRWLWISGNTYAHRAELKAAGCKWASKKQMWYWHPAGEITNSRRSTPMDRIRSRYGSEIVGSGCQPDALPA